MTSFRGSGRPTKQGGDAVERDSQDLPHYDPSQGFLLPPSLDDWLPEDHEARFIAEVVDDLLDLSVIYASYTTADGALPMTRA